MKENILKNKPFNLDGDAADWVLKTLSSMTVQEKIGQCFNLHCPDSDEAYMQRLLSFSPGAIHFSRYLLQGDIRKAIDNFAGKTDIPLLVSADLENGHLQPLCDDLNFHSPLGVAATGNTGIAGDMGEITAKIGKSYGINWTFTPNVDLVYNFRNNVTGIRTFGNDPETVVKMAAEYIRKTESGGLACTLKHWPGDGVDDRDQHLVTSKNSLSMDEWRGSYGKIYRELIDQGVKAVMSSHITLPAFDREIKPASLSRSLNINLLRDELGFNGLVVSDSTYMGGITSRGPRFRILPEMLENGCDMILFSDNPYTDISCLNSALQQKTLSRERLNEAVLRILAFKASLNLHRKTREEIILESAPLSGGEMDEIDRVTRNCIQESITLVKDSGKMIPVNRTRYKRVLLFQTIDIPANVTIEGNFREVLEEKGFEVTEASGNTLVDPDFFDLIIYALNQFEYFGIGSRRIEWTALHGGIPEGMRRYWELIPTIMISFNNPFHLYEAPGVQTYINAYSSNRKTMEILGDMLVGDLPFKGTNPVDPFCSLEEAEI